MDRLNLEEPMFLQADVLKLVPRLTGKTLQNWAVWGNSEGAEKQTHHRAKRRYTPVGVIMLAFMAEAVAMGIPPSAANEMCDLVGNAAMDIWGLKIERPDENGVPSITIWNQAIELYRRGYIHKPNKLLGAPPSPDDDEFEMRLHRDDPRSPKKAKAEARAMRSIGLPMVYLVIEVDQLVISMLNAIHRHVAGIEWGSELARPPIKVTTKERDLRFKADRAALLTLPNRTL